MDIDPDPSRYQEISSAAQRILAIGESDRYEFKRDVEVVSPKLLAALANWVALDPGRDAAHLLIGVEEIEDKTTGLVYGKPFGLPKGLDKAVARIHDIASKTRPIPVNVLTVEEGVSTDVPFVRLEIRPTTAPHFDDEGRRQTRQGRSTRALTDDELLGIYLDREAGSFAVRFRQTSEDLQSAVGAVGSQVDQIAEGIEKKISQPIQHLSATTREAASAADSAGSSADSAASSADSAEYEIGHVQRLVRDLQEMVEKLQDDSLQNLAYRVIRTRQEVWLDFTIDTWEHTSARADQLESRLRELLTSAVSLDAARNSWELGLWQNLLKDRKAQRGERGTQKWWNAAHKEVVSYLATPAYAGPELPELRAALKANLDHELDDPQSVTNQFSGLLDDN